MSTLYELTQEYEELYEMLVSDEYDEQTVIDTMEGIEGELEVKADGYARIIRQLEADHIAHKKEAERHELIAKQSEKRMKYLKERLKEMMLITGKTKFSTELFKFNVKNNGGVTPIVFAEGVEIPEEYLKSKVTVSNDTEKIRQALDAGIELPFAHYGERGKSLDIK